MTLRGYELTLRKNEADEVEHIFAKPVFTKAEIVETIKNFLPNFQHEEKGLNLDSKM